MSHLAMACLICSWSGWCSRVCSRKSPRNAQPDADAAVVVHEFHVEVPGDHPQSHPPTYLIVYRPAYIVSSADRVVEVGGEVH